MWNATGIGFTLARREITTAGTEAVGAGRRQGRPAPTKPSAEPQTGQMDNLSGFPELRSSSPGPTYIATCSEPPGAVEEQIARLEVAERHGVESLIWAPE